MRQKFRLEIMSLGIALSVMLLSSSGFTSFEAFAAINTINGDGTLDQKIVRQAGNTTVTNSSGTVQVGIGPNVVVINKNQAYSAGAKQTFASSSTTAGINVAGATTDPSSPVNGDIWQRSDIGTLRYFIGGITHALADTTTIQSLLNKRLQDVSTFFFNSADPSKQLAFDLSQIAAGRTDTWKFPNANSTFVGTNITQTITGSTTMNSLILGGTENANTQRITSLGTPTTSTDAQIANHIGLLGSLVTGACTNNQILKYQSSNSTWICASDTGLAAAITSINGDTTAAQKILRQSGNTTVTNSTGQVTIGVGPNVVITGGAAQTISKQMTFSSNINMAGNITSTAAKEFKISAPAGIPICIGTGC